MGGSSGRSVKWAMMRIVAREREGDYSEKKAKIIKKRFSASTQNGPEDVRLVYIRLLRRSRVVRYSCCIVSTPMNCTFCHSPFFVWLASEINTYLCPCTGTNRHTNTTPSVTDGRGGARREQFVMPRRQLRGGGGGVGGKSITGRTI